MHREMVVPTFAATRIVGLLLVSSHKYTVAFAPYNSPITSSIGKILSSSPPSTTSLSSYLNIDETAPRNFDYYDDWTINCGVQKFNGFQLASEDGLDVSVATSQNIGTGELLLGVPEGMILSASKAKDELLQMDREGVELAINQMQRIGAGLSIPEFYLILKLLVEFERGEQSPYFPWLDSLPRLYYNAVSMTDFCLECLPPLVFALSRVERLKFDNIMEVVQKVNCISPELKMEEGILKWAFNVVHTRSIGKAGENKMIVPVADMFNHGTDIQAEIQFDGNGNCLVYALQDVPAGAPLCVSYGCPTNPSRFFATYGFLDKSSPATFCKIMDIQSSPDLVKMGLNFSRMLFYKDTGDISEEVWDVVLYGKVLRYNPEMRKKFYNAFVREDLATKQAIHNEYALETAKLVQGHVNRFFISLKALNERAEGKDMREHPRLPLILSHNEFVEKTFLRVKEQLDPLVQQLTMQQGGEKEQVY